MFYLAFTLKKSTFALENTVFRLCRRCASGTREESPGSTGRSTSESRSCRRRQETQKKITARLRAG